MCKSSETAKVILVIFNHLSKISNITYLNFSIFETPIIKGALFYFPKEQELGGDTFIISTSSIGTGVFLGDFPESGIAARRNIKKLRKSFINFLELIHKSSSQEEISDKLYELDTVILNSGTSLALALLQLYKKNEILYFKGGENFLYHFNARDKILHNDLHHSPKLSIPSRFYSQENAKNALQINKLFVNTEDKLILCTDGLTELSPYKRGDRDYLDTSISELVNREVSTIIIELNQKFKSMLASLDKSGWDKGQRLLDDYTIITIQIK